MSPNAHPSVRAGLAYGLAGFFMWGLSPLYWRALVAAGPWEVLAYRIVGTVIIAAFMLGFRKRLPELLRALRTPRIQRDLAFSTLLIGGNWLCFVWAVMAGRTLEASLGYYLCPLVTVALGAILLKEPLSRAQLVAIGLATVGVGVLLVGLKILPWISLFLATSFAAYGYIRKRVQVDALEGLFVETGLWLAPSIGVLFFLPHVPHAAGEWGLLVLAGPFTLLPLLFYTQSARRLRLSTLGFIQYTAPTMQFLIATLVFHERVTAPHLIAFAAIWAGILIFTWDSIRRERPAPVEVTP
jgi:chloramphenicol-sensitive protein RarD